jgi:histone deacetylase HOS3
MTLRMRKPASQGTSNSGTASPDGKKAHQSPPASEAATAADTPSSPPESSPETSPPVIAKKLPRVILKVGPRPET